MIVIDVLLTFACFTNPSVHPGKKASLTLKMLCCQFITFSLNMIPTRKKFYLKFVNIPLVSEQF